MKEKIKNFITTGAKNWITSLWTESVTNRERVFIAAVVITSILILIF